MAVEFNRFQNYNNYSLNIGQKISEKANDDRKKTEEKEVETKAPEFKGLENETDLLTQNVQNLYGVKISKFTPEDKDIADKTNAILAGLGYDYKVSASQVASVTAGMKDIVLPEMNTAQDNAVAARIADPNGPFADLFA